MRSNRHYGVMRSVLWGAVCIGLTTGCEGWKEDTVEGLRWTSRTDKTDRVGQISVTRSIEDGETAALLTATTESDLQVFVEQVIDPSGTVLLDAQTSWEEPNFLTIGIYPSRVAALNWPIRQDDEPLTPGTWEWVLGVIDEDRFYYKNAEVDLNLLVKRDDSFDQGQLHINLIYAGAIAQDTAVRDASVEAMGQLQDIYRAIGIDVTYSEGEYADGDLVPPGVDSEPAYVEIAAQTEVRSVNVVIVPGFTDSVGLVGQAGGIPGPLLETEHSAVALSAAATMGLDLAYDDQEIALYAQSMAHEVGHFLGLFHPVEIEWSSWDALDDTVECDSELGCITDNGDNVMFPFAVCGGSSCIDQVEFTDDQVGVAHRYVGVE